MEYEKERYAHTEGIQKQIQLKGSTNKEMTHSKIDITYPYSMINKYIQYVI